ncbi:hypothetical protein BG003_003276 [Podila horticola]|nr:hypothetical protein BG003_003276 [Podila horticola]
MADVALQIPHILTTITDPLSFSDLISFILVCRKWHGIFIPILWADSILRASNCLNLVEINYLLDGLNLAELGSGLENLAELTVVNPQLTAVSIEGINLDAEEARDHLSWFLDFLNEYPRITSVYFDSGMDLNESHTKHWKDVWYRLLSRITTPTIHSVQVQSRTTRSRRALHTRRAWVVRESPIRVKIADSELRRKRRGPAGGRWESEYRHLSPRGSNNTTVMERDGHLVLGVPHFISWLEYAEALAQFQGIQSLTIDTLRTSVSDFLGPVQKLFPGLISLDLRNYQSDQEPVDNLLGNLSGLTSLSLDLYIATQPCWTVISRHYSVMTSLKLTTVPLGQFYGIVSRCPVLQELAISWLELEESAPVASPQWICPLRMLHLHIAYGVDMDYSDTEDEIAVKIDQGKQFADRVAPPFMRQLGMLAMLRELRLSFHSEERLDASPFLELSLDPVCGLPQLSSLRDLRSVAVSGIRHSIGQGEIEWMKRHWPKLYSLEVPIMQEPPYVGDTIVEWRDTYKGQVPEYDRWFAGLEVVVPDHCYSYWDHRWFRVEEEEWQDVG